MLCTRDAQDRPFPHECFLAEITANTVIGLVPEHLARGLPENAADNAEAALVASRIPGDHRSVQLKGRITRIDEARVRQVEFAPTIEPMVKWLSTEMPVEAARAIMDAASRGRAFRIQLEVTEAFDQSPGPKAGRPIAVGGS